MRFLLIILMFPILASARKFYIKTDGGTGDGLTDETAWSYTYFKTKTILSRDTFLFKSGQTFTGALPDITKDSVTFTSYGTGAQPIINGLMPVTGWTNAGGGIYTKVLDVFPSNMINMVLLDGEIQSLGRLPKANLGELSYFKVDSTHDYSPAWPSSSGGIYSDTISSLPNLTGAQVVFRGYSWIFQVGTVVTKNQDSIFYNALPALNQLQGSYVPIATRGFFFQNHVLCLTTLGEWAYNKTSHTLSMYFGSSNPSSHTIEIAGVDSLLRVKKSKNILLSNISFTGANEKGIIIDSLSRSTFYGLNISKCGIYGIHTDHDAEQTSLNTIDSCTLDNILSNGINAISQINNGANVTGVNTTTISRCVIKNIALIQGMGQSGDGQYMGIYGVGSGCTISNNTFYNIGYIPVYFVGSNVTVNDNNIHDFCITKSDGGGVYTYANTGTNRKIYRNIIYNGEGDNYGLNFLDAPGPYFGQVNGIYIDNDAENVSIFDNTVYSMSHSGIFLNYGSRNIEVTRNTSFNNTKSQLFKYGSDTISLINIHKNILFAKNQGSVAMALNTSSIKLFYSDTNIICRPVREPSSVDRIGYQVPGQFSTWNQGGVMAQYWGDPTAFYSLDKWKEATGLELHSNKTFTSFSDTSLIDIKVNFTNSDSSFSLGSGLYRDVEGVKYEGTAIIPARKSLILLKLGHISTINPAGVTATIRPAGVSITVKD